MPVDSDQTPAAMHVWGLSDTDMQNPVVYVTDLRTGRFIPARARQSTEAPPDVLYRPPARAPADDLIYEVAHAGTSAWERGDRYTRGKSYGFAIELVTHGRGELRVGREQRFPLQPGDVFILHPGECHTYRACSSVPFRKLYVALVVTTPKHRDALALTPLWHLSHLRLTPATATQAREIIERIIGLLRQAGEGVSVHASLAAYELIILLTGAALHRPGVPPLDPRVKAVMFFALNHISEPLAVSNLARVAAVSPDHLNRLFSKAVRMHTREWLVRLRMRVAAELLMRTRTPVYTIAAQVGYGNPYAFSRVFKQVAGMPPITYRMHAWQRL